MYVPCEYCGQMNDTAYGKRCVFCTAHLPFGVIYGPIRTDEYLLFDLLIAQARYLFGHDGFTFGMIELSKAVEEARRSWFEDD